MTSRTISFLTLLIPIACFADVPESIIGKWQFDSVRTISESMDQVIAANPGVVTSEEIEKQKAGLAKQSSRIDRQVTAIITSDTIRMVNETSGPTVLTYKVIGGNSRLVILDAKSEDVDSAVINIRLVEGGIAIETLDCQAQPEVCEHTREQQTHAVDTTNTAVTVVSEGSGAHSANRIVPSQPQWIYFRPFTNSSPVEK